MVGEGDFVDDRALLGARLAGNFDLDFAILAAVTERIAGCTEVEAVDDAAAQVVVIGHEIAVLARVTGAKAQTVRRIVEAFVQRQRSGDLRGTEVTLLIVETAAQANERIVEEAFGAQAQAPVVWILEQLCHGFNGIDARERATVNHAVDQQILDGGSPVNQSLVGQGCHAVAGERPVAAFPAGTKGQLAVVELVLVGGDEELGNVAVGIDRSVGSVFGGFIDQPVIT